MADERGRADQHKASNEYSGSQAPAVRDDAEERRNNFADLRLIPGGARGTAADPGMSGLDRSTVPSAAIEDDRVDYGGSPDEAPSGRKVPH